MFTGNVFRKIMFVTVALMAMAVGVFTYKTILGPKALELVQVFPKLNQIPALEAKNHKGDDFNQQDFLGKWSFVFFGFTYCPDVCPTTLANMNQVAKGLSPELAKDTQFVLISVDPERDTVEKLAQYVPAFNKDFIGVNATLENTRKFTDGLGVPFFKTKTHADTGSYLVEHSARWFIVDPLGRRYGMVSPGQIETGQDLVELVIQDYSNLRHNHALKIQ